MATDNTQMSVNQQLELNKRAAQDTAQIGNVPTITPWGRVDYHGRPGEEGYFRTEQLNPTLTSALQGFQNAQNLAAHTGYQRLFDFGARYGPLSQRSLGVAPTALSSTSLPGMADTGGAYGTGVGANIRAVEDAAYARATRMLEPGWQQQERGLRTRLANQGIASGTRAYQDAMGNFQRMRSEERSNAANQAVLAGRAEHQRLFDIQSAQRAQEAALQNQQWTQLAGWRQQNLNEQAMIRQQALGETGQLLNIGNIQQQSFAAPTTPSVSPTNYLGYLASQNQIAQQRREGNQGFLGGVLGTFVNWLGLRRASGQAGG